MLEIAGKPVRFFLDFNAVIVNLDSLAADERKICVQRIEENVKEMKGYIEENLAVKESLPDIPETGLAVLRQQLVLAEAVEAWIRTVI